MGKPSLLSPFKAVRFLFEKPVTLRYPFEQKEPARRYRGFHLNDWEACTGCGNCADICPNDAITMIEAPGLQPEPGEKNERPQLDYGRCCFCGLCVDICPPASLRLSRDFFHIHFDTDTFTFVPRDDASDDETFLPADQYSILKASLSHRKRDFEGFAPDLDYALFEPERVPMSQVPADERKVSFVEQVIGYTREQARSESLRCLECKLCEDACPAHLKISDYVKALHEDDPGTALQTIFEDNPLPAICGRICMKHCEDACSLGLRGEPVAIRWLKRYAADSIDDYQRTLEAEPAPPTGRAVAVIGAGASGLALAYYLRLKGHAVTVFDVLPAAGGMLRIGPPQYRLPPDALDKDADYIASTGVEFRFNTAVGEDVLFEDLMRDYDAVYIGVGLHQSRTAHVENEDHAVMALDFLRQAKGENPPQVGREVIVIGGGNVAMDVARTCLRLQQMQYPGEATTTKTVSLESWDEMPASDEEVEEAKEEGIQFNPAWGPESIAVEDDQVKGLKCKAVKSVFDEQGRFSPTFHEDKTMVLDGDMVIEAIGQGYDLSFLPHDLMDSLEFTERRKVKVDENGMTSIERVFAGGDIVNLNMDAVTAIADARQAAEGIHELLTRG
ncbi:MAG: FAD-dependent oxidoreductase [Planctomycetota bacterium]